jgi:CoA-dependent NAD(P)H sulfur oxidoreductase
MGRRPTPTVRFAAFSTEESEFVADRLVVIGGGAAGMSAASSARRVDRDLEIVVAEASGYAAWGLCGIPYYIAGLIPDPLDLVSVPPEDFRTKRNIDLRLHTRAVSIDTTDRRVILRSATGDDDEITYTTLIVAAGASPAVPPIEGVEGPGVHTVRTLEDAIALREAVTSGAVRSVLVVGGGYIGLEMADALTEAGCTVTVVEAADRVMPNLDPDAAARVEAEVASHCELLTGVALTRWDGSTASLSDGRERAFDAVVMAVGIRPGGGVAADAGAATHPNGALVVDERMRTTLPGVFAAGDCAAVHHLVLGGPAHIALGPTANKTGRVAGIVAAGGDASFGGMVGTAVAKIFDLTVARTGLTLAEARVAGLEAMASDSIAGSRAKYYPGASPTWTRLVHAPGGRLLGAQMISSDPATAKRIDVVATALHAGFDIDDLGALDLSYAPPYAPVYDPILRAAQAAAKQPA